MPEQGLLMTLDRTMSAILVKIQPEYKISFAMMVP